MKDPCFLSKSGIDLAASVREQIASQEKANQRAYLFELFFIHVRRVAGAIQTLNMTYAQMAGSDLFLALAACSDEGTIAPRKPIFLKGGFPYAELGGEGSRSTIPSRQHPGTLFASFGVAARRANRLGKGASRRVVIRRISSIHSNKRKVIATIRGGCPTDR